jgi:peptidoglycan hydrolase CwlO-like protein
MTQLFIQLTQSVTGAVITIVALLLVAAIIGYFSAWFYAKSVYTPVIKGLEADKKELNSQIDGLNSDIIKLNSTVDKLNEKIRSLEKDIVEKDKELKKLMKPEKLV